MQVSLECCGGVLQTLVLTWCVRCSQQVHASALPTSLPTWSALISSRSSSASASSPSSRAPWRAQLFFAVSGAGSSTTLVLILTELTGFYARPAVLTCTLTELELYRVLSSSLKYRSATACCETHVRCFRAYHAHRCADAASLEVLSAVVTLLHGGMNRQYFY